MQFSAPALSTRARLLLLVFAVWLPAAIAVSLLAHATYVRAEDATLRALEEVATTANRGAEAALDREAMLARALGASAALRARDLASFHGESKALTEPGVRWVFLVDRTTQLANSLLPAPARVDRIAGAPFLQEGDAKVVFSPRGPVTGQPVLAIFAPETTRPAVYNVGVSVSISLIQSLVGAKPYPLGAIVSVIDANGVVMARSRDGARWVGSRASEEIRRRIAQGQTAFARSVNLDGDPVQSFISPPTRYGWRTVVALPDHELASTARALTMQALAVSVLLLAIGLALALAFSRTISRSVLTLRSAALELANDRALPPVNTPLTEANEVGNVLHAAAARIHEATTHLQARVQQAVTQARQSQAKLLESQKREAIGRLTGGLAHDFNNLLQTISMGMEVVARMVPSGRHDAALRSARDAAMRAAELVRQIQTFGRSAPTDPQPVDVADFVLGRTNIVRNALGRGIAFEVQLAPHVPAVLADPAQLELALLNLIFNARDAMVAGGRVVLVARIAAPEEALALGGGAFVAFEVIDDGVGIPPEALPNVFEPYFTTKPVGAGTGLGLAQVMAFARQAGGDVHIQSVEGEGTRVLLLLPVSEQAVAPARPSGEEPATLAPLRILMVEDDPLVGSVVAPALRADGHEVDLQTSADAALLRLSGGAQFDVLFTDVVMPGAMNGLDLARWAHEHRPQLAVLVSTGYTPREPPPGSQVLRKPYLLGDLRRALAGLVSQG